MQFSDVTWALIKLHDIPECARKEPNDLTLLSTMLCLCMHHRVISLFQIVNKLQNVEP